MVFPRRITNREGLEMPPRETLSITGDHVQGLLFPMLADEAGPLTECTSLAVVLEVAGVETDEDMSCRERMSCIICSWPAGFS